MFSILLYVHNSIICMMSVDYMYGRFSLSTEVAVAKICVFGIINLKIWYVTTSNLDWLPYSGLFSKVFYIWIFQRGLFLQKNSQVQLLFENLDSCDCIIFAAWMRFVALSIFQVVTWSRRPGIQTLPSASNKAANEAVHAGRSLLWNNRRNLITIQIRQCPSKYSGYAA